MVELKNYSLEELNTIASAGAEVVRWQQILAKTDGNIVAEALRGGDTFYELDHYPEGDVYDAESASQFYYHSHREGEHGHFHTFLRCTGIPSRITPVPLPDFTPEDRDDGVCHIVAISMDVYGLPIGLFTTNRWICADVWYKA